MSPATWPRDEVLEQRLLVVDPGAERWRDARVRDLPAWLAPGDLLVVNDAATLPASLFATTRDGARVELRLAGPPEQGRWRAVLFGEGDWRTRTEDRPLPPVVSPGDRLTLGAELACTVESVDARWPRLLA